MADMMQSVLLGGLAADAEGIRRELHNIKGSWADAVARLSRDNERLRAELAAQAATAWASVAVSNAIVQELRELEANPSLRRVLTDPANRHLRQELFARKLAEELAKGQGAGSAESTGA